MGALGAEKTSADWLPDMDLNHDKQIQSLLCYRYTIGQGNLVKLKHLQAESRNCAFRISDGGFSEDAISAALPLPIRNPQSAIRH